MNSGFVRVFILLGSLAISGCGSSAPFREEFERFQSIEVGMTEQQVRERLGQPFRVYERTTPPSDYYAEGYSFEQRPITNKVLIYVAAEPITYTYTYLDDKGCVEEVFLGGS